MWAKKLIKLDDIKKIFDLKKGNRDRVVSKPSDSSLVKKEREQVKIKRYAGMDGNFLSHAHYRDPFHLFIQVIKPNPSSQGNSLKRTYSTYCSKHLFLSK